MAIDKIFKSTNLDDVADNILSEVDDFVFSVDKMQQRKVAGNVQKVVQAFRQIETELQKRYDNVTDVLEKRITSINDGRDGLNGTDGRNGRDGKPGRDGINGKQGPPGTPGKDGEDGLDGVSVTNANIDFDGSLVISLSSGQQINVGEIVPPELERQLVEFRQGGGSAGSSGDVMGPTASTDNAIARFDGTDGKLVQNSVVTIADTTGNMAGVGSLAVGTTLGVTGVSTLTGGAVVQGLTVGRGGSAVNGNSAFGSSALSGNTTGSNNTSLGFQAMTASLTGDNNTVAGFQAASVGTAFSNVAAFGNSALKANTASDNTAVGAGAALLNTSGTNNTIVGRAAFAANLTGGNNTAVGHQSLQANTTASNNTAVGYQAGYTQTTAAGNAFYGYQSGYGVTSGAKNVILGSYTGSAAPISATGSNFVVLSDGDGNIVASTKTAQTFALPGGTLSTGTGIAFPATQSASTDANTLDDYEEGTFTPNQGAGLTVVGTFSSSATYVKVGKMVTVQVKLDATTSITISAGDAVMFTNLPFASSPQRNPGVAVNTAHSAGLFVNAASTTVYSCGTLMASATIFVSITYQTS
jgi:hypothetical protein